MAEADRHPALGTHASRPGVVMITGANSGIGLEFARQYAAKGWLVIATHRKASTPTSLADLAARRDNVAAERMDVADGASVRVLAERLGDLPIDVLINNAGVAYDQNDSLATQVFGALDYDLFDTVFSVNVMGALQVTEAFIDNVAASTQKKVICISSTNGSLTKPLPGSGGIFYRASKSALNRAMQCVALACAPRGVIVTLMHPGSVMTERNVRAGVRNVRPAGYVDETIETPVAVGAMIQTIAGIDSGASGAFLQNDGSPAPW